MLGNSVYAKYFFECQYAALIATQKVNLNKITTELKSFQKLVPFNNDQQRDLAYEIIAFANRQGGRIIFGVKDSGELDELVDLNIDSIKGKLHQLSYHSISPVIECTTQYIDDPDGRFLIVYIPKRKGIPHAYVPNRKASEINSRIYYIRTSHGKKLVTDDQLEWLFQNQGDPSYQHSFRIAFEFDRELSLINGIVPMGNYSIFPFRQLLAQQDRIDIENNNSKFVLWMSELMPYLILSSLKDFFRNSWHIGKSEEFGRMSSGPMISTIPILSDPVFIHEISNTGPTFLHGLSWDFKKILKELFPDPICLPQNTTIEIKYSNQGNSASIIMTHADFRIEILTGMLSGGAGLHQKGTTYEILSERHPESHHQYAMANFLYYDAAGYINAKFNFPEFDMREFKEYLNYYQSLKSLLDYHWNYQVARSKYPGKEILVIDDKLNEVLSLLRPNNGME